MEVKNIEKYIDQTFLKPEISWDELKGLLLKSERYGFTTVYVHPIFVKETRDLLSSDVKVGSVVGFPLGFHPLRGKLVEAEEIMERGVDLIDMVMNINKFKSGDFNYVLREIGEMKDLIKPRELKVIIETGVLTREEIKRACEIVIDAGADYVKTSTGFYRGGAEEEVVRYIKKIVGEKVGIKASGGIRDYNKAASMIEAGAERIGTSAGFNIVEEYVKRR